MPIPLLPDSLSQNYRRIYYSRFKEDSCAMVYADPCNNPIAALWYESKRLSLT